MKLRRAILLMLLVLLVIPASRALATPRRCVETPIDPCSNYSQILREPVGELGPAEIAAWIAERQITGLEPEHWAAGALVELAMSDGLEAEAGADLRPDRPVTFFEAARWVMVTRDQSVAEMAPAEIARRAVELKPMAGPAPEQDRPLTRLDAAYLAAMLTAFSGVVQQEADPAVLFVDWSAVPEESRTMIYWVTIENRLFVGYPDRTFRPNDPFTLGQYAVLTQRLKDIAPAPETPSLDGP